MPDRRSVIPRRPAPLVGAGLVAVAGILLLTGGAYLLAAPPSADARSFAVAAAAPPASAPPGRTALPVRSGAGETSHTGAASTAAMPVPVSPSRISFTDASVTADVVPVATLASGALQLPDDPARVGWWVGGAAPGQSQGTIVLAGHIAGSGRMGAMSVLLDVGPGQTVAIEDRRGVVHPYRIVSRSTAPKENLDPALFVTDGPPRLVLITCGGTFDDETGRYSDNVVVIAEPVPE